MTKEELYNLLDRMPEELPVDERNALYFSGKEVDCLPYSLCAHEALAHCWGITMGDLRRSKEKISILLGLKKKYYGEEGISAALGLRGLSEAAGSTLVYPEHSDSYVLNPLIDDYKKLNILETFNISQNPILQKKIETVKYLSTVYPTMPLFNGVAGPLSTAVSLRPIEFLLRDMRKNPDQLHRLLKICTAINLDWVKYLYNKLGISIVSISDPMTTTDILGPKYYKEFSEPYIKELFDGIVTITGQKPSLHICGHSKGLLNSLVEIGFSSLSIDNCESLSEFKKLVGEKMLICGNVPPVEIMRHGTIDDVISSVCYSIEEGSDNPSGFIVMPGCQVPIGTPKENIDAFQYAVRTYGSHAKLGHSIRFS